MLQRFAGAYLFLPIFFTTMFFSCQDEKTFNSAINGQWSIDTVYYKDKDIRFCLDLNAINFSGHECALPIPLRSRCINIDTTTEKRGFWKIEQTDSVPITISFDTENTIFGGSHRLIFKKDSVNKLLKMEIKSKNLTVICRKFLFSYDENTDLIDKLTRLSE
jgi:hypothetical protein